MGSCKYCRFWDSRWSDNGVGACGIAEWADDDWAIGACDMAFFAKADDDQGLEAGILTGPEFGCNRFCPVIGPVKPTKGKNHGNG